MSDTTRVIVLIVGLAVSAWNLQMLVRRRLNESNTLLWLCGTLAIIVLSIRPTLLNKIAEWVGVDYPPTLLFLVAWITLTLISLHHSAEITKLQQKIQDIAQYVALKDFMHATDEKQVGDAIRRETNI